MRKVLTPLVLCALLAAGLLAPPPARAEGAPGVVRGADELYWVPTLEQAETMAAATGRPIFLMGYSLVGDGSTYDKKSEEHCTGVY